jgi:hypothetical protein
MRLGGKHNEQTGTITILATALTMDQGLGVSLSVLMLKSSMRWSHGD